MDEGRFARAIDAIDAANGADPNRDAEGPRELVYGRCMSAWLDRLDGNASEPLRLAVRAQHIERWSLPRKDFPDGKLGYLRWRTELARRHATRAGDIMAEAGYDEGAIRRVQSLIRKENLKTDPEAQVLEDTACLVFLETELAAFSEKHDAAKVIDILRKAWRKMSERGRTAALALDLSPEARTLVARALEAV